MRSLKAAEKQLKRAIKELKFFYSNVKLTGEKIIGEEEEIISIEVILTLETRPFFGIELGGWVNYDRRDGSIWFDGIIIIEGFKIGGGYNDMYKVIRMDYDKKNSWSKPYID